jgi:hypothetical protein
MRTGLTWACVVALAVVAAGCGGTKASSTAVPASAQRVTKHCRGVEPKQLRERKLLERDLAAMRVAAEPLKKLTLMGSPAMQQTTGKFIDDVDRSSLPNLVKSRYYASAGAIVAGVCEQCFQMIEADRPVAGGAKIGESC